MSPNAFEGGISGCSLQQQPPPPKSNGSFCSSAVHKVQHREHGVGVSGVGGWAGALYRDVLSSESALLRLCVSINSNNNDHDKKKRSRVVDAAD